MLHEEPAHQVVLIANSWLNLPIRIQQDAGVFQTAKRDREALRFDALWLTLTAFDRKGDGAVGVFVKHDLGDTGVQEHSHIL